MAYLRTLTTLIAILGYCQAALLHVPKETGVVVHSSKGIARPPYPTAPSPPHLVDRMLNKRVLTQTCGVWNNDTSWVCTSTSYCVYGPFGDFSCWGFNFTNSVFSSYNPVTECFNAAQWSSTCGSSTSACAGRRVGLCDRPSSSECSTFVLTGKGNYSAFHCGPSAAVFVGSLNSNVGTTITVLANATTSMEQINRSTVPGPSIMTVTTVSVVTVRSGSNSERSRLAGIATLSTMAVALLHVAGLFLT